MEKYKNSYKNNKSRISAPEWTKEFELLDGSYSVSDIQSYFIYILKRLREKTNNLSISIYVNEKQNKMTFKIKTGYYLELLTLDRVKLLSNTKSKITKDENGENAPHLEITEVVLVYCNIVNNYDKQDSRVLYIFFLITRLVIYQISHLQILYF